MLSVAQPNVVTCGGIHTLEARRINLINKFLRLKVANLKLYVHLTD